ncbi:MAG: hypothetical protein MK481_07155 [SAR324 cluster bacterium]|nr:hypothetical protein [SAR324 cluster bacterium]
MNDSYTKKMLVVIAFCTAFFSLTWGGFFSFMSYRFIIGWKQGEHIQQRKDELVCCERIIELMEEMVVLLKKK